jgi:hypothetical protein
MDKLLAKCALIACKSACGFLESIAIDEYDEDVDTMREDTYQSESLRTTMSAVVRLIPPLVVRKEYILLAPRVIILVDGDDPIIMSRTAIDPTVLCHSPSTSDAKQ